MKSIFTLLTVFFSIILSVYGKYADKVVASEVPLATSVDVFYEEHSLESYQFVALARNGSFVVQIRLETDEVIFEAFFSQTGKLLELLASVQTTTIQATIAQNYTSAGASLEDLQNYRWDGDNALVERSADCTNPCKPYLCGRTLTLDKRASRCGQFCSVGANCVTPYCRGCYYTGGACYWQKSCQYNGVP